MRNSKFNGFARLGQINGKRQLGETKRNNAKRNETMGEMHENTTIRNLCESKGIKPDTLRMRYAKLRADSPTTFPDSFRIDGELTPRQVYALTNGWDRKGSAAKQTETKELMPIVPELGRPNEVAPQGTGKMLEMAALIVAFTIPTLASAFNTYNVSHQVAKDWRVAFFVMAMVMLTPALFIAARVNWVGAFVAFGVVVFEGFCNLSAIYLSLMGGMEYILEGKRGVCSDFLQSVVNLTNSDHRPTAVLIGGSLAALIALTQLTAFWAIRNRLK